MNRPATEAIRLRIPAARRRGAHLGRGRLALVGAGVFLIAFGLLVDLYIAPRLIVAPTSVYEQVTLLAPNASYFDQGTLTTRRGVTLTYTNTIRGDPAASTDRIAVWDSFAALEDLRHGVQVSVTPQRVAFDRGTAQLIDCCGASVNGDTRVHQSGIGLFWPIGVRKTTYQMFDASTERAWPAVYDGQATVDGVRTYRFVQHVPATRVDQMPDVPSSLLHIAGRNHNVAADRYYQADTTLWVDPRTGVAIDHEQKVLSTLRAADGRGHLVVADLDLKMSESSRRHLAAEANRNAASITLLRTTAPIGCGVLGSVLLTAGAVRVPRKNRSDDHPEAA